MASRAFLSRGMKLRGCSGRKYEVKSPCRVRLDGLPSSTWLGFDINNPKNHYIIKQPFDFSDFRQVFHRNEAHLGQELRESPFIRRQVDFIPEVITDDGQVVEPQRLVQELMQKTVWDARWQRAFTRKEIKSIMKSTLHSLMRIESLELVNMNLCMENMFLNNHHIKPRDPRESPQLVTKLAGLSHCFRPQHASVVTPPYRAPEVHSNKKLSYPAHVWSWGRILANLLEAQTDVFARGTYGTGETSHCGNDNFYESYSKALILDGFSLENDPHYYGCRSFKSEGQASAGFREWSKRLEVMGLREDDIRFLSWVLEPNPDDRPTMADILQSRWLEIDEKEDADDLIELRHSKIFNMGKSEEQEAYEDMEKR